VLPVIIIAVIAIPLLVIAARTMRRRDDAGEHPAGQTGADQAEIEKEFEESERYQAEWREEQRKHQDDTLIP
jgi:hypothetical protein